MILILFFAHKASPPPTHDLSDTPGSTANRRWHASAFAVPERHISDSGKSRDANGFRKIMAARCIGLRSALRLTHVLPGMPAATSSTKKLALLRHTHENTPEMHLLHLPTPTKTLQKTPIQPAYTQKEHSQATFCPPTLLGQITPASLASEKNQKHTATHVPSGCRTAHKGKQKDILCNVFTKSYQKVLQKHKNVLPLHTQYGDKACQARQDTPGSTLDA